MIPEIKPLPPLPYEQLEMLPVMEELPALQPLASAQEGFSGDSFLPSDLREVGEKYESEGFPDKKESVVRTPADSVVYKDGTYRIDDGIYNQGLMNAASELKQLADEVLQEESTDSESTQQPEIERHNEEPQVLDFDAYLQQQGRKDTDMNRFKTLVKVSRLVNAVAVVVLMKSEDQYKPVLSVGMEQDSVKGFRFQANKAPAKNSFDIGKSLIINEPAQSSQWLKDRISQGDQSFINRSLFFPCLYQGKEGVIFFGFAKNEDIDMDQINKSLIT